MEFDAHQGCTPFTSVALTSDGGYVIAGNRGIEGRNCGIRVWNINDGTLAGFIEGGNVMSLSLAPGGENVLAGYGKRLQKVPRSGDCVAILWNLKTKKTVASFQHGTQVDSVAISPNGFFGLSASWGGTTLWDLRSKRLRGFFSSTEFVNAVSFSKDSRLALIASGREVRAFDLAGRLKWTVPCEDKVTCIAPLASGDLLIGAGKRMRLLSLANESVPN
jgi:hypothetical protein